MTLMKGQCPTIQGFQDVLLAQSAFRDISHVPLAVNINHTRGNHWVTTSYSQASRVVIVYHSIYNDISPDLERQISQMYNVTRDAIVNHVIPHQTGGTDCGLFAIAYCFECCYPSQIDTSSIRFDQRHLRSHLLKCLESGTITKFPVC